MSRNKLHKRGKIVACRNFNQMLSTKEFCEKIADGVKREDEKNEKAA